MTEPEHWLSVIDGLNLSAEKAEQVKALVVRESTAAYRAGVDKQRFDRSASAPHIVWSDILRSEAEWLDTAHANSASRGLNEEYRKGFAAAAGWVRFHARNPFLLDGRITPGV